MDEESVGLFGALLIVAALVLTHPLSPSHAVPSLSSVSWHEMASVFMCGQASTLDCAAAFGE